MGKNNFCPYIKESCKKEKCMFWGQYRTARKCPSCNSFNLIANQAYEAKSLGFFKTPRIVLTYRCIDCGAIGSNEIFKNAPVYDCLHRHNWRG